MSQSDKNCPVAHRDVINAHKIFGLDLAEVRGKAVRKDTERVVMDFVEIPPEIRRQLSWVTLTGDVILPTSFHSL